MVVCGTARSQLSKKRKSKREIRDLVRPDLLCSISTLVSPLKHMSVYQVPPLRVSPIEKSSNTLTQNTPRRTYPPQLHFGQFIVGLSGPNPRPSILCFLFRCSRRTTSTPPLSVYKTTSLNIVALRLISLAD